VLWEGTVLKALALAMVIGAGFAIGRAAGKIDKRMAALAVVVAAVLHTVVMTAVPHTSIEQRLLGNSMAALITSIALLETCGLWLPAALVPWSDLRTRAWIAAYLIGAAVLGEVVFYFPGYVEVFNDVEKRPEHPGSWSLLFCLVFAAAGFFFGRITRPRQPA
jgi:MFS family permease